MSKHFSSKSELATPPRLKPFTLEIMPRGKTGAEYKCALFTMPRGCSTKNQFNT